MRSVILILFFTASIFAQSIDESLIRKMMTVTGTISSLSDMEKDLKKDIIKFYPDAHSDDEKIVYEQISAVFNKDTLIDRYIKHFSNVFDKQKVDDILEVYEDPLFIRITELESRDIDDEELSAFIRDFDPDSYSSERKELVERLITAARLSEFTYYAVKSSIEIAVTVSTSLSGQTDQAQAKELIDIILQETQAEMDSYMTMMVYKSYNELSDDEFEQYVEYYETELGKWHTEVSIISYLNTFAESADIFSSAFPAKIRSKKS